MSFGRRGIRWGLLPLLLLFPPDFHEEEAEVGLNWAKRRLRRLALAAELGEDENEYGEEDIEEEEE